HSWHKRVLISGLQYYFVHDVVMRFAAGRRTGSRILCRFSIHEKVHRSPAASERLFLAGLTIDRWVHVLRTCLEWEHDQLFGAAALGVHVGNDLEPGLV